MLLDLSNVRTICRTDCDFSNVIFISFGINWLLYFLESELNILRASVLNLGLAYNIMHFPFAVVYTNNNNNKTVLVLHFIH